jgi:hypothetical protein
MMLDVWNKKVILLGDEVMFVSIGAHISYQ